MPQFWKVGTRYVGREEMLRIRKRKDEAIKKEEKEMMQMDEVVLPLILHKKDIKSNPEKVKEIMEKEKAKIAKMLADSKKEELKEIIKETKVETPN